MSRTIKCTNTEDNIEVVFGANFAPFLLQDVEGIYNVDVNVNESQNSMSSGSTVVGSVVKSRNIVLTVCDVDNHGSHRNLLYLLFKPNSKGTLTYEESDSEFWERRTIDYFVEKVEQDSSGKQARQAVISLICPDPFFKAQGDKTVSMTGWDNQFEWEHEFADIGEEFAVRVTQQMVTIENESSADKIGLTINIEADGSIENPKIYHAESDSFFQLGSDDDVFEMIYGDKIIITTETNNKNVYLIRDGVKTVINEYINEESEYIQLISGSNTIQYSAASGVDNMLVSLSFRAKYQGV